jgi:hypothetical protein
MTTSMTALRLQDSSLRQMHYQLSALTPVSTGQILRYQFSDTVFDGFFNQNERSLFDHPITAAQVELLKVLDGCPQVAIDVVAPISFFIETAHRSRVEIDAYKLELYASIAPRINALYRQFSDGMQRYAVNWCRSSLNGDKIMSIRWSQKAGR